MTFTAALQPASADVTATDFHAPRTVPLPARPRCTCTDRAEINSADQFFLGGWIDTLGVNEIITHLVLRFVAQAYPNEHAANGVFLTSGFREGMFNLDRGFEGHRGAHRRGNER